MGGENGGRCLYSGCRLTNLDCRACHSVLYHGWRQWTSASEIHAPPRLSLTSSELPPIANRLPFRATRVPSPAPAPFVQLTWTSPAPQNRRPVMFYQKTIFQTHVPSAASLLFHSMLSELILHFVLNPLHQCAAVSPRPLACNYTPTSSTAVTGTK